MRFPSAASAGSRNAAVLALCQGLFTCAISIDLTLTALTGWQLAPDKALATLPFALITVAGAVVTWFAAFLIQRLGRRWSFVLGAASCCVGGLISVWSVFHGQFWTFCAGTALVGVFQAFAQYYRLAAADAVSEATKSRAISTVLAGGVIAALVGPALAAWSKDWFPTALFAGAYLVVAAMGLLSVLVLILFYRDQADHLAAAAATGVELAPARPLSAIARTPVFMASVANNVAGSMVMMFIMTAAPLAAVACHHGIDDGAAIIQWHLVGMYAPSFFAGRLIQRFGLGSVLLAGLAMNLGCALIAMLSTTLPAFYVALLLLGVGWNFMFVGGTTLLAQSYTPSERAKTQGLAELMRYAATALATLGAGPLLARFGWETLNAAILPVLLVSALVTGRWMLAQRAGRATLAAGLR
ncbi:major facilitator superfamily permease [Herbaspirillum frisingense GSF30]|uniref:Major facilitator superfamily permease n=1 Tax=Herbaspirillum frisingense GSF30 TaxID=864073 RepID=A0AAI9IDS4_9BURK|nr:MFS transporter [Herbaspirillum frisingense]EOA04259.1 major facilitator superfamily permease [Herbaspirillum frisingense GSF30]